MGHCPIGSSYLSLTSWLPIFFSFLCAKYYIKYVFFVFFFPSESPKSLALLHLALFSFKRLVLSYQHLEGWVFSLEVETLCMCVCVFSMKLHIKFYIKLFLQLKKLRGWCCGAAG